MAGQTGQMSYDRGLVISPDGRLFQVEYAREIVKRGTTAIGIKARNGVALLVDKKIVSRLLKQNSIEKIFQIDKHIGAACSGLIADARILIDRGRIEAQANKIVYDEAIDVETLTKKICNHKQAFTQYGGLRPFGVALLIAGVYNGNNYLFETDPSGALLEYEATAIGSGRDVAVEILEKDYDEDIALEDAVLLGLKILDKISETETSNKSNKTVDIGLAELAKNNFRILNQQEIEVYIKKQRKEKK